MFDKKEKKTEKKTVCLERTDEIFHIMTSFDQEIKAYLDVEAGKIIYINTDKNILDPFSDQEDWEDYPEEIKLKKRIKSNTSHYLKIPLIKRWEPYIFMKEFIETVENRRLQNKLSEAIQEKGAFRRFKDLLFNYPEWEAKWYDFQDIAQEERVKSWLEEEGFNIQIETKQ